jgi:hypothetical protein
VLAAQVPDAPTNLVNVPENTARYQNGLSWVAPEFDGGSPILDYRIWTDESNGPEYVVLVDGLTDLNYIATGLTQGLIYTYKVEVRNLYGYSVFSNTVSILAA